MKFRSLFALLPLATLPMGAFAQSAPEFQFTTQVSRTVEKDLMIATLFVEEKGKSLPALKKKVASELNPVIELAKKSPAIQVNAQGVQNSVNYQDGEPNGWRARGEVQLASKDFEAMANVLENLGEKVAVQDIEFQVSAATQAKLEDEMTQAAIAQFKHKAEVVKASLNAKGYRIKSVELDTPTDNSGNPQYGMALMAKRSADNSAMPLEAGKATLSATARGTIEIEEE